MDDAKLDKLIAEVLDPGSMDSRPIMLATSASGYDYVRSSYRMIVAGIITEYLYSEKSNRVHFAGQLKGEANNWFYNAFDSGWYDGGGDISEVDREAREWLETRIKAEWGFIDMLFLSLKDVRDNQDPDDWTAIIDQKAEGYTKTLDGVYNEGKIRAGKDVNLTFVGEDGQESCRTCQRWKNKRHRKSFWVKRNLIPGQPGNDNFECRGYNCQHYLIDDEGNAYTF